MSRNDRDPPPPQGKLEPPSHARSLPRSSGQTRVSGEFAGYGQAMRLIRPFLLRRFGLIGVVLTVYDFWRRLPNRQRRRLVAYGRRRGMRVATRAWALVTGTIGR